MAWPEVGKEIRAVLDVIEERLGRFVANAVLASVLGLPFLFFASLVYQSLPVLPAIGPESLREGTRMVLTMGAVWVVCSVPFLGAVYWLRRSLDARYNRVINSVREMQNETDRVVEGATTTIHNAVGHIERDFRQIEETQQEITATVSDMQKVTAMIKTFVNQREGASDDGNAGRS